MALASSMAMAAAMAPCGRALPRRPPPGQGAARARPASAARRPQAAAPEPAVRTPYSIQPRANQCGLYSGSRPRSAILLLPRGRHRSRCRADGRHHRHRSHRYRPTGRPSSAAASGCSAPGRVACGPTGSSAGSVPVPASRGAAEHTHERARGSLLPTLST